MKTTLLLGIILFLLFAVPGDSSGQPLVRYDPVLSVDSVSIVPVKRGFHHQFRPYGHHHYGFRSFRHHGYRHHGFHGYDWYRYKHLYHYDKFRDLRYPRYRPYYYYRFDGYFGFHPYFR